MKLPTADDLSICWGVGTDTVYARRMGRTRTPVDDVVRAADAFGLDVEDLAREFTRRRLKHQDRQGITRTLATPDPDVKITAEMGPTLRSTDGGPFDNDREPTDEELAIMRKIVDSIVEDAAADINAADAS